MNGQGAYPFGARRLYWPPLLPAPIPSLHKSRGIRFDPGFAACFRLYGTSGCCLALENSGLPPIYIKVLCPLLTSALTSILGHSRVPPTSDSLCRPPGVSPSSFPPSRWIYPPDLRMTIGRLGAWPDSPVRQALYPVSVRRNSSLPMASFRFRLAMDTLAFGYKIPVITALKGLEELSSHLLEVGHARHTKDVAPMEQGGWIVIFGDTASICVQSLKFLQGNKKTALQRSLQGGGKRLKAQRYLLKKY